MKRGIYILFIMLFFMNKSVKMFPQEWISIDGTQQGEAVDMTILKSDSSQYQVKVIINGLLDYQKAYDKKILHKISFGEAFGSLQDFYKPSLPVISQCIAIPSGRNISVSISEEKWTSFEMGTIIPTIPNESNNQQAVLNIIQESNYDTPFLPQICNVSEKQIWRGVSCVNVIVCPFKYFPNENKLTVMYEFILNVSFLQDSKIETHSNILKEEKDALSIFDNKIYRAQVTDRSSLEDNYDYLILVGNPSIYYSDKLKEFVRWKALKGLSTKTVLYNPLVHSDEDIKDYIYGEYLSNNIQYVLFVGDENAFPLHTTSSFYFSNTYIDSDYWYGCMDGTSDWIADVAVGRFSTNSSWEFGNIVDKTIRYESIQPQNDSILLVAHQLVPDDYFGYQRCCENIRLYPYASSMPFITAYGASISEGGNDATNADVVNIINRGIPVVNYRGYGYPSYWGGYDGGSINYGWNNSGELFASSQIDNFGSSSNAVFFSVSANTGDITATNNMLESFTRATYGAAAFVGSTANQYPIQNHIYDMTLFGKLYEENVYYLGSTNVSAHISSVNTNIQPAMSKDNAFSYICGGDPTLELWTDTPRTFGDVNLTLSNGIVTITTEYNGSYLLSVVNENGELIDKINVYGNSCSFSQPSGNFYIGITCHNYVPHIIYYDIEHDYIQNTIFSYDAYYTQTPMNVGYGVTADVDDGEVIVKPSNKLVLKKSPYGVTFDFGFKCEKGAELIVQ